MSNRQALVRIMIVDDHPLVREGMAMRISGQRDLEICGEAATEEEAIALVNETRPDLMIVDISLKSGHGISLIKQVKSALSDCQDAGGLRIPRVALRGVRPTCGIAGLPEQAGVK